MNFVEQTQIEADADDLEESIIKQFGKYGVSIGISKRVIAEDRVVFLIKLKGNTREAHIRAHAPDVQLRLKIPLFYVDKYKFNLCLIASQKELTYDHLMAILNTPGYRKARRRMQLPYVVGHDVLGRVVMNDLAQFPHLLLGGSTNSGKSVGLQALITSIAYSKPPDRVNFVLIDVGATSLMPFEGLPHLSCPIVRDRTTAMYTLATLITEMERRVALEYADPASFKQLPRLVVVIDEFPALFMGAGKSMAKELTNNVSNLLQRGRHAKMHMVLAAQNPTSQNMKIDLGNITARIAFKCAKRNFSETILGEGGAENLMGQGDLLLRSPQFDVPHRVQGVYIAPKELQQTVQYIKEQHCGAASSKFNLTLPSNDLTGSSDALGDNLTCSVVKKWPSDADQLLASAIYWALEQDYISINALATDYHLGWNKASTLIKRLEDLGIVDRPEGKLPRKVIPTSPEDIPEELIRFLQDSGYSVCSAFYNDR